VVLWLFSSGAHAQAQTLAFPTAEGFGRFAQGGRGGRVIQVTNLNASGPGSFRACLEATGPRTCIFRVGGIIDWPVAYPPIPPYLTIAGQTAPGDGIMLKSFQLGLKNTHNIIVRHLRLRPGETVLTPLSDGSTRYFSDSAPAHDIIFDHISTGWATDDTDGGTGYNVTYQWSIISEGLGNGPSDPSKCLMHQGDGGSATSGVSVLHTLMAHVGYRCPQVTAGHMQVVNNLIYNTNNGSGVLTQGGPIRAEFVNNYYVRGPQSEGANPGMPNILFYGCTWHPSIICKFVPQSLVYLSGNYHNVLRPTNDLPEDALVQRGGDPPHVPVSPTPLGFPIIPSQVTALQTAAQLPAKVGALVPTRDSIDARAVNSFLTNTGGVFDTGTVGSYGGYPVYNSGTPYPDTDGDGMSDAWETAHGLNPNDAADGPVLAANGYTNLENFLNELAGDTVVGPGRRPTPTNPRAIGQSHR
jgi:hypothetical protein